MLRLCLLAVGCMGLVACTSTEVATADNQKAQPCGIVSVFSHPPEAKDLYKAVITRIDDYNVVRKPTFKVTPGKHLIKLNDIITDKRLSVRGHNRDAQYLELNVEPYKKYHIAARFFPQKRYTNQGDYWAPEVWKVTDAECVF